MVYTAIRDNQPPGAMMPSPQHPLFARIGAMSAAALIAGSFASLATTCGSDDVQSWEELGDSSPSFRRQNLAGYDGFRELSLGVSERGGIVSVVILSLQTILIHNCLFLSLQEIC
jgi:hypothetical protein